jgi:hypothetical protein
MDEIECEYCKNIFGSKKSLTTHHKSAKYCLSKRGKTTIYVCLSCNKILSTEHRLQTHYNSCVKYQQKEIRKELNKDYEILRMQLELKDELLDKKDEHIKELESKLENIALKAVSSRYEEPVIEIEIEEDDSDSNSESDHKEDETYHLTPLDLGKNYNIKHRDEDGFINVTDLCKAGDKSFKAWKRLQKTTAFLKVLSGKVLIHTSKLISTEQTSNTNKTTWVHPQVAINIAQWISPKFDVMVSAWVYEVMMSGKVDISNTKTYRQLQSENKDQSIKIQYLTKKYVKSQPRVQYKEHNVIYILTTKNLKKERRYILGKAVNLTNRLSTYNKSDEHEVVFYQECPDEETMGMVETMVFQKLKEYREQANRERFILPKEDKIEIFSDIIKKCLEFLK